MNKEKIYVYLLSNLLLIIGEDEGKEIKNACRLMVLPQGPAIASMFMNVTERKEFGMDINKNQLQIIDVDKPIDHIKAAYLKIISGESIEQPKIITMKKPPVNLN